MSKHAADGLALVVGAVVLALGLVDLADTAEVFSAGAWLLVPALLLTGVIGIAWTLRSTRTRPEEPPPAPQ